MLPALRGWGVGFLEHPKRINRREFQACIVLVLCRILYTFEFGQVVSKPRAASWVKGSLGEKWGGLIDRAWVGRQVAPQSSPDPEEVSQTLSFIRGILTRIEPVNPP